jgi:type IV secretory pathway TrbL component
MNTNPLKQGNIAVNLSGIGAVTWEMVKQRASEIAAINGRTDGRIQESDWEEARRELTGSVEADPTAGTEGWGSTIGGRGKVALESPGEDTDEEGHSTSAQLVEQGLQEAEHDTMLRASKRPIRIPIPNP